MIISSIFLEALVGTVQGSSIPVALTATKLKGFEIGTHLVIFFK